MTREQAEEFVGILARMRADPATDPDEYDGMLKLATFMGAFAHDFTSPPPHHIAREAAE